MNEGDIQRHVPGDDTDCAASAHAVPDGNGVVLPHRTIIHCGLERSSEQRRIRMKTAFQIHRINGYIRRLEGPENRLSIRSEHSACDIEYFLSHGLYLRLRRRLLLFGGGEDFTSEWAAFAASARRSA